MARWTSALTRIIADSGTFVPASIISGVAFHLSAGDPGVLDALEQEEHGQLVARESGCGAVIR